MTSSGVPEPVDDTSRPRSSYHVDQRRGLLLVEVEPPADGLLGVVVALDDLAAAVVAGPVVLGGVVDRVVGAAVDAHPAAGEALEHDVRGHLEVDDEVERPRRR